MLLHNFDIQKKIKPKKCGSDNYTRHFSLIFEAIRNKKDGGTLIGVHQGLNPVLIKEYSEKFELLVVEISVLNKDIRIISGYGPQESWPEDERCKL